jgi:hypothetical protein
MAIDAALISSSLAIETEGFVRGASFTKRAMHQLAAAANRFKIIMRDKGFTGSRCGVNFRQGRGYTNDEHKAGLLRASGYKVIDQGARREAGADAESSGGANGV